MAPNNIGPDPERSGRPSYQQIRDRTVRELQGGGKVFAGPADDPFFGDIGAAFDAVTIRNGTGSKGGGVDAFAGFNVHATALQLPITAVKGSGDVVGVWAASYRPKAATPARSGNGRWVQVSRLGNPLMNELLIPTAARTSGTPTSLAGRAEFDNVPPQPDPGARGRTSSTTGSGSRIPTKNRTDLMAIFHQGLAGLNKFGRRTRTCFG